MIRKKIHSLRRHIAAIGTFATAKFIWKHELGYGRGQEYWIHPAGSTYPVCVRGDATDAKVFKQIFVDREYACLKDMQNVRLLIDCGANVGYSSAYLLTMFPESTVIAVEPDPKNFAMLERNLAPFGKRAKCMRAGVWSHPASLVISEKQYRTGGEWSRQVRLCKPGETAEFEGVDLDTLRAASGHDRISLLKMDVEGAEAVVFAENYQSWLDRVDAIAIELHDDTMFGNGSATFFSAIEGGNFEISRSGELSICRRDASPGKLQCSR